MSSSGSRAANANPTRQISNHPTTHGTHANVARSLSSTAASLALNSADTLSTCEQNTRHTNCPCGNKMNSPPPGMNRIGGRNSWSPNPVNKTRRHSNCPYKH